MSKTTEGSRVLTPAPVEHRVEVPPPVTEGAPRTPSAASLKTPRPVPVDERRCVHQGPTGQCKAYAQRERPYCYLHDPDKTQELALARSKGGVFSHRRGWRAQGLPDAQPPQSARGVADIMAQVIAGVLRGKVDPRIANSTAYCVGVLIKAIEVCELEKRIDMLEKALRKGEQG